MKKILKDRRLLSLDAFRGLTIAGMILVNNPGSWKHVYAPLRHAKWHGWTFTDLIFPFFLFIVGVSISISLSKKVDRGVARSIMYFKILKRTLILFALGILLALIPSFNLETLRIPGVLQRIALCYLFSSVLFLKTGAQGRTVAAFSFLGFYWIMMKLIPVPGYGAGILEYEGNLCAFIDSKLLAGHLFKPGFDPEGILSTLPAISTALLGTLTGDWLRSSGGTLLKTFGFFIGGSVFALSGLLFHPYFPINKQLWTSTYVLFTAGAAMLVLGVCYGVIDGMKQKKWAFPFIVFGTNAIAVYVGSSLMAKLIDLIQVSVNGNVLSLKSYIYTRLLVPLAGNIDGSLIFALLFVFLWIGITIPFYRKKIFIKI